MKNKTIKMILIFMMIMMVVNLFGVTRVYAIQEKIETGGGLPSSGTTSDNGKPSSGTTSDNAKPSSGTSPIDDPSYFEPTGGAENSKVVRNTISVILGVIQTIGAIVAVMMIMFLGIRYMVGSIEEKASYKKTMIPYIVGAFFIFVTPKIVSLIYDIVTGM